MPELPTGTPPQDRSRVDLTRAPEVSWWCTTLGVSEQELRDAVAAAGTDIREVRRELGQGRD